MRALVKYTSGEVAIGILTAQIVVVAGANVILPV